MRPLILCLVMAMLNACPGEPEPPEPVPPSPMPELVAGPAQAGVYDGFLRLPAGVPLGGYTSRDSAFGGTRTRPRDLRKSPWSHKFHPSTGHLTGVPLQALWLSNGDRDLVLLKVDLIGSFDGLVGQLENDLSRATAKDMVGSVVVATSHSHSAPAAFFQSLQFALGFDRYDPRVYERIATQALAAALSARENLAPARLGFGIMPDFDPLDDNRVYRDRRGENNHLVGAKGEPATKDPSARVMKVESQGGDLMAVVVHVGLHGTLFEDDNPWIHWDAPGAVARGLSVALEGVPVLHFQAGGGDMSPAGQGETAMVKADDIARVSGRRLKPLVEAMVTSEGPFILDSSTATVVQQHQVVRVERGGGADFHYTPVTIDEFGEAVEDPDNRIFNDDGSVIEAIDEFQAPMGAGLCGDAEGIPFGTIGMGISKADPEGPYIACAIIDQLVPVIAGRYEIDIEQFLYDGSPSKPLNGELSMGHSTVSFARFDGLPITTMLRAGGQDVSSGDIGMLFMPGETTSLYNQLGDARLQELGFDQTWVVGYAQDHEGYLLTIEDWLAGGYEPSINIWGPLQGEYLLEKVLALAKDGRGSRRVDHRGLDEGRPAYGTEPLAFEPLAETRQITPGAGQRLEQLPEQGLLLPLNRSLDHIDPLQPPSQLRRISDLYAFAFEGGDVSFDSPRVYLEQAVESGEFRPYLSSGAPVDSDGPAILMGYSSDPARAAAFDNRRHLWVAMWQPIGEGVQRGDWAEIETGRYRFVVEGQAILASGQQPEPYRLVLEPFDIQPTSIEAEITETGMTLRYAPAVQGFRKLGEARRPEQAAPLPAGSSVTLNCGDVELEAVVEALGFVTVDDPERCAQVTDQYGNSGQIR